MITFPLSDTTIAATTTQGIGNKEKFKANIFMVGPAVIITVVALALYPIDATKISAGGAINFVNLVPYILIIALSLAGMHAVMAMTISVISGMVIGVFHGSFSCKIIHGCTRRYEGYAGHGSHRYLRRWSCCNHAVSGWYRLVTEQTG